MRLPSWSDVSPHPLPKRDDWPADDNLWELHWFGRTRPSGHVPTELQLDVLLRRADAFLVVRTGIGQIPALKIGQLWRNGEIVGATQLTTFRRQLDFSPTNCRLITAAERLNTERKESTEYLIPPYVHPLSKEALGSRCLAIGMDGVPDAVIIPCMEIARAWYLRSTKLTLRLTSAPYSEAKHLLFNERYEPTTDKGTKQVVLRTGLSAADAYVVAMLACDRFAGERASLMMDSLAQASSKGTPTFLEALPPVQGRHVIAAKGRRFTSGGQSRFLVHHLTSVPYPAIGATIEWDLDNSQNADDAEGEVITAAWPRRPNAVRARQGMKLRHSAEPDSDFAEVVEFGALPDFLGAPNFERMPPRAKRTTQVTVRPLADPPPGDELSTGQGQPGCGGPGALRIKTVLGSKEERAQREIIPASFEKFLEVVESLGRRDAFRCTVIAAGDTVGPAEAPRTLFPTEDSEFRGWWYLVNGRARQFIVVEVAIGRQLGYLWEVERRTTGRKKPESFTLAAMAAADGRRIEQSEFDSLARRCVRAKGVWPSAVGDVRIRKIRHAYSEQTRFVDAIASAIVDVLGQAHEEVLGAGEAAPESNRRHSSAR